MKRTWLLALTGLIAVFAIGAVACSSDKKNNNSTPQPTSAATTGTTETPGVTPGGSTTPNGTPQASGTVTGPINVTLNALGGSGVTGTAVLTDASGATSVVVTIDGGLTEGEHANHIHTGTCEAQGDIQDALTPLQATADGKASGSTPAVPEPLSNFTGGNNYVAVHATDGTVVACGDIPTS